MTAIVLEKTRKAAGLVRRAHRGIQQAMLMLGVMMMSNMAWAARSMGSTQDVENRLTGIVQMAVKIFLVVLFAIGLIMIGRGVMILVQINKGGGMAASQHTWGEVLTLIGVGIVLVGFPVFVATGTEWVFGGSDATSSVINENDFGL